MVSSPGGHCDDGVRKPDRSDDLDSTRTLLELTRAGDIAARDRLIARYLPALQAWAHGRVPRNLRRMTDTEDLVHEPSIKALERMDRIEYLHEGGFFAYLRTILRSKIIGYPDSLCGRQNLLHPGRLVRRRLLGTVLRQGRRDQNRKAENKGRDESGEWPYHDWPPLFRLLDILNLILYADFPLQK